MRIKAEHKPIFILSILSLIFIPTWAPFQSAEAKLSKSAKSCALEIQDKFSKHKRSELAKGSARIVTSTALFGASVAVHLLPLPALGTLAGAGLSIGGSKLLSSGTRRIVRLYDSRGGLGRGGLRLLRDLTLASQIAPLSPETSESEEEPKLALYQTKPIFDLKALDSAGRKRVTAYTKKIQLFSDELNRKYVHVLRAETQKNIPYISPVDIIQYFLNGTEDQSVCSLSFFTSFKKGGDFFLASQIISKKLADAGEDDMQVKSQEMVWEDRAFSGGIVGGVVNELLPTSVSSLPQGESCLKQLETHHWKTLGKEVAVGSADLAISGVVSVVPGLCLGAYVAQPVINTFKSELSFMRTVLDATLEGKSASVFTPAIRQALGKVPVRLPFRTDEAFLKNMALASFLDRDTYVAAEKIGSSARERAYDRYTEYLGPMSERLNLRYDLNGCNTLLTEKTPNKSDQFPAILRIGKSFLYLPKKGHRPVKISAKESKNFQSLFSYKSGNTRSKGKVVHLDPTQCAQVNPGFDPQKEISQDDLRGFLKDGVSTGLVCKPEFTNGMKSGGEAYLATSVTLYKQLQSKRR